MRYYVYNIMKRNIIKNIDDFKKHKSFAVLKHKNNDERIVALGGEKTRQQKLLNSQFEGIEIVWEGDVFDIYNIWKLKQNKKRFLHGSLFK